MTSHSNYNREYKKSAIYRITINLSDESGGDDGNIRAAREMATVATRQQGFINLNTIENGGITTAYELLWSSLEAIDIWRSGIYESALHRYGKAAWKTFENMSLETVDLKSTQPGLLSSPLRSVTNKVRTAFSKVKSA